MIDADGHQVGEGYDFWVSKDTPRDCVLGTTVTVSGRFHLSPILALFSPIEMELAFEEGGEVIPSGVQMNDDNTGVK